ncbi:hypothetical protein AB4Z22_10950 [Paenibacillus sp. TAF58]
MALTGFTGYHGTSKANALNICRTNFSINLKPKRVGWLGAGAYFFEGNKNLANYWSSYRYSGQFLRVLESELELDDTKVFDITHPLSQDTQDFHNAREELIQIMIEHDIDLEEQKSQFDGKTIDYVCQKRGMLLVRAFTYTYKKLDRDYKLSSKIPNGIELCVKHVSVIKSRNMIP